MLKIPLNLIQYLVNELTYHYILGIKDPEEEEEIEDFELDITDIKLMDSISNKNYFIGACLINYDTDYDNSNKIYIIDFISLKLITMIYENEAHWEAINGFNEQGIALINYGDGWNAWGAETSTDFINYKEFEVLFIKSQENPLNWTPQFIKEYENYILRFINKLTLLGELHKINFESLQSIYNKCYNHSVIALNDLEKDLIKVKAEINTMLKEYPCSINNKLGVIKLC